ncbi:MAG TPA: hypothetical protein VMU87_01340 [Stellaceae bacterium]|nr:hypothetical protein [Stellaceae bacterium]
MNALNYLIGGGQLALLAGIWFRLGAAAQRMKDHEANDVERFTRMEREISCLPRS